MEPLPWTDCFLFRFMPKDGAANIQILLTKMKSLLIIHAVLCYNTTLALRFWFVTALTQPDYPKQAGSIHTYG